MKRYGVATRIRTELYRRFISIVRWYYNHFWGTHIGEGTRISLTAKIDKTFPDGIRIGKYSAVTFRTSIMTHDFVNNVHLPTTIGDYCFIGAHAVIMPGVTIGDHCIIGAGSVVLRDVPAHSLAFGNPARVIERNIQTGLYGARIRDGAPAETAPAAQSAADQADTMPAHA
ncbi:acyltransferase [Novosphingobium olei]|uniref:acyltransferase n=2 Tax=Novosphingobium olei TaxID=2728851 RepID=UPI00308F3AFA|nr:acyltransferase [Novosphingobium olei]